MTSVMDQVTANVHCLCDLEHDLEHDLDHDLDTDISTDETTPRVVLPSVTLSHRRTFGSVAGDTPGMLDFSYARPHDGDADDDDDQEENGMDLLAALRAMDDVPSRAPTPPPRAAARGTSALGMHARTSSSETNSSVNSSVANSSVANSTQKNSLSVSSFSAAVTVQQLQLSHTTGGLAFVASPGKSSSLSLRSGRAGSVISDNSSGSGHHLNPSSSAGGRLGRFLRSVRSNASGLSADTDPSTSSVSPDPFAAGAAFTTTTTITTVTTENPNMRMFKTPAPVGSASSSFGSFDASTPTILLAPSTATGKRHTRRFSTSLRTPWAVTAAAAADHGRGITPTTTTTVTAGARPPPTPSGLTALFGFHKTRAREEARLAAEPDCVFGVSLSKSIRLASSSARTHHAVGTDGASRRAFPLGVHKCYAFLSDAEGVQTPGLFASDSKADWHCDWHRVRTLRDIFSTGPDYGADLDLAVAGYSRHDAAALILLFLEELPKPLVPDSVARRWIALSRQAAVAGASRTRLDQCIDFWEEALGGVRGHARSLLKLLLNLWGAMADAAPANGTSAERLAARVLPALLHLDEAASRNAKPGRHATDYMLGVAFIIRKRSEYALLLRGDHRKSNAAFV